MRLYSGSLVPLHQLHDLAQSRSRGGLLSSTMRLYSGFLVPLHQLRPRAVALAGRTSQFDHAPGVFTRLQHLDSQPALLPHAPITFHPQGLRHLAHIGPNRAGHLRSTSPPSITGRLRRPALRWPRAAHVLELHFANTPGPKSKGAGRSRLEFTVV